MINQDYSAEPELKNFQSADYTAIVSDLHLCEEEPAHPKYPLWKKYKTRPFFFDHEFSLFVDRLHEMSNGKTVELILNGDIFDFDSCAALPADPIFYISWLERRRGLHPQEEKSTYKINVILDSHKEWVEAVRRFVMRGHRAIFVIGNHDLELHFPKVQAAIRAALHLPPAHAANVRFNEWFYISNGDTLIEHGNQYDPYCMAQDPTNPYIQRFNRIEVRVPFGNLATRYLINGMGFFNPHLDSNYIMTPKEYLVFFIRYIARAQPFLIITWFWGATVTLVQSFLDRLRPTIPDPLGSEDRVEKIAAKSNATPRMVREMKELFVAPAASYPSLIMKELWLDRAFLIGAAIVLLYILFLQVDNIFDVSIWWMFIPFFLFVPFLLFYSRSIRSVVHEFKEPREDVLSLTGMITKVTRVVYGHTHIVRHEMIGAVEHLNSGTWSPAFLDVECERPIGQKTFVWIYPGENGRQAKVCQIRDGVVSEVFATSGGRADRQKLEAIGSEDA
jgi:UDP-2,3-diacylglucosamine pyrophosphatase LpxH